MAELSAIIERQNELFGFISRTVENLNKLGKDNITLGAIKGRIKKINQQWEEYQDNHKKLLTLEVKREEFPYFRQNLMKAVDESYAKQIGVLLDLEIAATPMQAPSQAPHFPPELVELLQALRAQPHTQPPVQPVVQLQSQLPRINLPKFDGNYTHWPQFRDLFTSLVGSKPNLPPVEKFHNLKTSLEKEALQLINNLAITDDNYQIAWDKLKNKYENKRLLVNAHLASLDAIPPAKSESATELKRILLSTIEAKDALQALGRPVDNHEDWLVHKTTKRLDPQTRRDWETANGAANDPISFGELQKFLETRIKALEAINEKTLTNPAKQVHQTKSFFPYKKGKSDVSSHHVATTKLQNSSSPRTCSLCSQEHFIWKCDQYKALSPCEKRQTIISKNLCLNCLGAHKVQECKSRFHCFKCSEKHHTSMHGVNSGGSSRSHSQTMTENTAPAPVLSELPTQLQSPQSSLLQVVNHSSCTTPKPSLLATAYIRVIAASGAKSYTRALVDSCSTDNLVSESLSQRLRLPRRSAQYPVSGTGKKATCITRGAVSFEVKPHFDSDYKIPVNAFVVRDLTHYVPNCQDDQLNLPHLKDIQFADPDHSSSQPIEVILGVGSYSRILEEGIRKGPDHTPIAQKTALGWILLGELSTDVDPSQPATLASHQCHIDKQLPELLQKFWEQEEILIKSQHFSDEEQFVEDHFKRTHSRGPDGRYTVCLPIKQPEIQLGDSLTPATRMFQYMERRFSRNDELQEHYSKFMDEYLELGHIEKVDVTSESSPPSRSFYLPHHGVLKATSTTTKLRVVFNGSQKTDMGNSLNAQLCVGPKLLPELPEVLLKWRSHKIAISSDMEKMYRQIWVHESDRDLQRLLWYDRDTKTMATYRLTTVPFGLSSSPFQAIRTLHQLADDEQENYPVAAKLLKTDAYVDDILSGADDLPTAFVIQEQLINLLKAGGFALRKWTSNNRSLVDRLPADMVAQSNLNWQSSPVYKMLGLTWQPDADHFIFNVKMSELPSKTTKRHVLSMIAQLFDPLGWLAPAIVTAKIFMQSLWQLDLGWDEPLPDCKSNKWKNFYSQLNLLAQVKIPRYIGLSPSNRLCELHGFSDASEQAYSAVLYIRVSNNNDLSTVRLLVSKTKVAPLKMITLPKLELNAALLLAKLSSVVQTTLNLQQVPLHLHSDSTITLHWIRGHPTRWKTFVANRVSQIQRLVPDGHWHHVSSGDNPADIATRELDISDFIQRDNWWNCSALCLTDVTPWPTSTIIPSPDAVLEEKTIVVHQTIPTIKEPWDLIQRYSQLTKLSSVTAWILRFVTNAAERKSIKLSSRGAHDIVSHSRNVSPLELENAKQFWIHQVQKQYFQREIDRLTHDPLCNIKGPLARLTPFIDDHGLLRVGGRLKHSLLDADEKQPVILPRESFFTTLIIRYYHEKTLHGGIQLTLCQIRRKYWILRGRSAVKTIIFKCLKCWRQRKATAQQLMGNLPKNRVTPSRAFLNTGVDYAGPIWLKTTKGRGHKANKGYISVFVCLATRAIHLEVVSDYTSDAFIAAYKRFTARRGICATLRSDCGTTLVGADAELRKLFDSARQESRHIEHLLAQDGTQWIFNPPAAPHFGGIWEAGVKSTKHHLKRTIGESTITFEEMSTLLAQVEACLNSRPLQALTDDPDDLSVLTPGHFLIGGPPATIPEPSLADISVNRLSRWQLIRQQYEHFWQRWSHEYLHEFQTRSKWQTREPQVKIGDLAVLKNELQPTSKWVLARIIDVHPGQDGVVRVVTVRTATSTFKRPIVKLCLLPRTDEKDDIA
ncbi:uncharacterized protein LOC116167075 [Photinus pyralis]|nr:uncharacterized protein LOC116167075 [Photinus pyralis]